MRSIIAGLAVLVLVVAFAFGAWHLKRWFNYSFGYEGEVRTTICEMVKPEVLKKPC